MKILLLSIFLMGLTSSLYAASIGHKDITEEDLNDPTHTTVRREIHVEFTNTPLTDLINIETFGQADLTQKIQSRIQCSIRIDRKKEADLAIIINIRSSKHIIAARALMKELGYIKYNSNNPNIQFENLAPNNQRISDSIDETVEEYWGEKGLL